MLGVARQNDVIHWLSDYNFCCQYLSLRQQKDSEKTNNNFKNQKMIVTALILFVIFLTLSMVHLYWGFGGKWKINAAIPTNEKGNKILKTGPLSCFVVALGLLGFAFVILDSAKILSIPLPRWISLSGLWIISAIFILRAIGDFRYVGYFKKIQHTAFAKKDSKIYSPLCLAIGISCILLEWLR